MFVGVVNPATGSSIGLELVKILGGGFISLPGRMRVLFGDRAAPMLQVPTDARLYARTPVGVLVDGQGIPITSSAVDVTVQILDDTGAVVDSATKVAGYTYQRTYKATFDAVAAVVIAELRSLVGDVVIDTDVDYSQDGVVLVPPRVPIVLLEGPNLIRDEFRTGREVPVFAAGNSVPRLIPPWARVVNFEYVVIDDRRQRAIQTGGHITRWLDSGPSLTVQGQQLEVYEDTNNQLRIVQVAGQDYTNGRIVAYRGGFNITGFNIEGEAWDIAVEMLEPNLALGNL